MNSSTREDPTPARRITAVENFGQWFEMYSVETVHVIDIRLFMDASSTSRKSRCHSFAHPAPTPNVKERHLAVISYLYDKKIGELGCVWDKEAVPIEYKYARVTFGELFEFYTAADGVLRLPKWYSLKYAVDQYLDEEPRIKFHPQRVRQFIQEHGMEHLETME